MNYEEMMIQLKECVDQEEPTVLSPEDKKISLFCPVLELNVDGKSLILKNPILPVIAPYVMNSSSYILKFRSWWMKTTRLLPYGTNLKFLMEEYGQSDTNRSDIRKQYSSKDNAYVEIVHPYDKATLLKRCIYDLSEGGMSFRVRMQTPFCQKGRHLPQLNIYVEGQLLKQVSGKIVYVRQIIDWDGHVFFQVGVRFI